MKTTILILLTQLALTIGCVNAQTLIPNGSFEDGMTGWTLVGNVEALGPPRTDMPVGTDGTRAAAIGTFDGPNASMSEVLHLTGNQAYSMTFDLLASGVGVGGLTGSVQVLLWDGTLNVYSSNVFSAISPPTVHNGAEGFIAQQFVFSLASGVTDVTLTIQDVSPNGGFQVDPVVDNIRLATVPEPGTCLFVLAGLSGGFALRKRRKPRA
jgi:hypothetical protein